MPSPNNWRWRDGPVDAGPAVVFDMDGVLSDAAGRQHHLARPRRDWDAFFAAVGEDEPIAEIARLLEVLDPTLRIVLLTARPIRVQAQTLAWLARHELRWDLLVMRDQGDYGAAREFKRDAVGALRSYGFELRLAFELKRFERDLDLGAPGLARILGRAHPADQFMRIGAHRLGGRILQQRLSLSERARLGGQLLVVANASAIDRCDHQLRRRSMLARPRCDCHIFLPS